MFSRRLSIGLFSVVLAATLVAPALAKDKARVLVYSGSTGYRHESIPAAVASIKALGEKAGYVVDTSEDPEVFTAENLAKYRALVLVSNSTDPKKPESEWFTGSEARRAAGLSQGRKRRDRRARRVRLALQLGLVWPDDRGLLRAPSERHAQGHGDGGRRQTPGHGQTTQDASNAMTSGTTTRISIRRCAY